MKISLEYDDTVNKLLLIYLINKMDMPLSRAQIVQCVISNELMHNFVLEQNLSELVKRKYLDASSEASHDESTTRYTLTEDGHESLELFETQIPLPVRKVIDQYVEKNRDAIRKDFEKTAHYFYNAENDEYTVKCGVYDDKSGNMLMEISIPVLTREQVKFIQTNWNANYGTLYQRILGILTGL